jgi:ABC-type phosphate transport system substrate-binding protein
MVRNGGLLSVILTLGLLASHTPPTAAETPYRVIVNPSVRENKISRAALSSIFLKWALKWGDSTAAFPVDQSLRSGIRAAFTRDVLRQEVDAVSVYWQQQMASGVVPPKVKSSNEEVISFVASTGGAIGYVSADATLPPSVKVLTIVD